VTWLLLLFAAIVAAAIFVGIAYARGWTWTGFARERDHDGETVRPPKTLWDWLQLLLVPFALAAAAFVLNQLQSDREQRREDRRASNQRSQNTDAKREDVLRDYLQQMSDLMLDRDLLRSRRQAEVRALARALTLTAVRQLDGGRKGQLVRFLAEADLIHMSDPKVYLGSADLRGIALQGANLADVQFAGANLSEANLRGAHFAQADFSGTHMWRADLSGAQVSTTIRPGRKPLPPNVRFEHAGLVEARFVDAKLIAANFGGADLRRASFRGADLFQAVFSRACITGADFTGAYLRSARLDAGGEDVDFSEADTHGADAGGKANFPSGWRIAGQKLSRDDRESVCG
jgi:uncharacterized protein YjbI with pentapeptide repeats